MLVELRNRLAEFQSENKITSKGKLAAILYMTRQARIMGLPLNPSDLVTDSKGQVQGLGKAAVQAILAEYGILRTLAEEGGRTSRGSLGNMQKYIHFLNSLHDDNLDDMVMIEKWWIERVHDFFTAQPFILRYDTAKSLRAIVRDLLAQAYKRQKENPGTKYAGAVLQHLVGAKLSLVLPEGTIEHHGFSVSDAMSGRSGDFMIGEVVFHVTTAPSESLMEKCKRNLESGVRPIIVTTHNSMPGAESLAGIHELEGRIDILEAEQFIATNLYEISRFETSKRRVTVEKLIESYNEIVSKVETDPSFKVQIG
ncbi:DUF4928 family protein [Brevibacillus gelatini]|uniref:DUF4928 family protein n=1 Tax=Brevibacillus gelatini TaxID=1655277 RepID=UPI003D818D4B